MRGQEGGFLAGDDLDQTLAPLDAWGPFGPAAPIATSIGMVFALGNEIVFVRAQIDSYALVPVPGALWMFGGAIAALARFGKGLWITAA